ncbi:MAG TPA: ADP-glyceromanno-heptose 6-epimerase [Stellaceae bacterium]|nr:ADP-glyceromanno-heptose 6-epimerase [Stellaceae bacterium]
MIVVTGGAGFIGSNLVAALEARGRHDLVICDRLRQSDQWRNLAKREIAALIPPDELFEYLDRHTGEIDGIFHLGAISATTEADADLVIATNFTLSQRIWSWCAAHDTRLIYASSAATYGDGSAGFADVSDSAGLARFQPLNSYGWSKHLFDRWVARRVEAGDASPPSWAGVKFFNVYGPNEYHKQGMRSLVAKLYPKAVSGEPAMLFRSHRDDYPDGGQLRDFVAVEDCVDILLWLWDQPKASGLYNAGSGIARSFADLATAVYHAVGRKPRFEYIDTPEAIRPNYQYFTQADLQRLRAAGYAGQPTPLEAGIDRYVRHFLAQPDPYR